MSSIQPYFAGRASGGAAPRLLLVTYSFPPGRAVGALRWERLAAYLGARGWIVDVISVDPADLKQQDPERLAGLSPSVRAFGVPHPVAGLKRAQARLLAVRASLRPGRGAGARAQGPLTVGPATEAPEQAPEQASGAAGPAPAPAGLRGRLRAAVERWWERVAARAEDASFRRWADAAAALGTALIREHRHALVVTSGPPHMAHVAGRAIAQRTGLPLVTDFRDPWARWKAPNPGAARLAAAHERTVIQAAALVVLNNDAARELMAGDYPGAADRMITVMNGTDGTPAPPAPHGTRFVLAFAGNIYRDRDPAPLFRALRRVVDELGLTPADIGIEMVGGVQQYRDTPVAALAARAGVAPFVTLGASVSRAEALAFQGGAHMLVSLPQASMTQIPAKTFEYANFSAWMLVFAPAGSATEVLLRGTGAHVVGLADVDGAAAAIRQRYLEWRAGADPVAVNADGRFDRDTQARKLANALEALAPEVAGRFAGSGTAGREAAVAVPG